MALKAIFKWTGGAITYLGVNAILGAFTGMAQGRSGAANTLGLASDVSELPNPVELQLNDTESGADITLLIFLDEERLAATQDLLQFIGSFLIGYYAYGLQKSLTKLRNLQPFLEANAVRGGSAGAIAESGAAVAAKSAQRAALMSKLVKILKAGLIADLIVVIASALANPFTPESGERAVINQIINSNPATRSYYGNREDPAGYYNLDFPFSIVELLLTPLIYSVFEQINRLIDVPDFDFTNLEGIFVLIADFYVTDIKALFGLPDFEFDIENISGSEFVNRFIFEGFDILEFGGYIFEAFMILISGKALYRFYGQPLISKMSGLAA